MSDDEVEAKELTEDDVVACITELRQRMDDLEYNIPTKHCHIPSTSEADQWSRDMAIHASTTRPVVHVKVLELMEVFLATKKDSGSLVEQQVYATLDVLGLLNRCLTKRPLMFKTEKDEYMLKDQETYGDRGNKISFDIVGTDKEEATIRGEPNKLVLENVQSYEEMELSALLAMSVPTHFIQPFDPNKKDEREESKEAGSKETSGNADDGSKVEPEAEAEPPRVLSKRSSSKWGSLKAKVLPKIDDEALSRIGSKASGGRAPSKIRVGDVVDAALAATRTPSKLAMKVAALAAALPSRQGSKEASGATAGSRSGSKQASGQTVVSSGSKQASGQTDAAEGGDAAAGGEDGEDGEKKKSKKKKKVEVVPQVTPVEKGVYIGLVGSRFERQGWMEWKHMVVTEDQNAPEKGYGKDAVGNNPMMAGWAALYGLEYLPSFKEAVFEKAKKGQEKRFLKIDNSDLSEYPGQEEDTSLRYLDQWAYRRRCEITAETFLAEAEERCHQKDAEAFCHVVGQGLGSWRVAKAQNQIQVDAYGTALAKMDITNIGVVFFTSFGYCARCSGVEHGKTIKTAKGKKVLIEFGERHLAAGLPLREEGQRPWLMVAQYEWNSNSYPGNQYWDLLEDNTEDILCANAAYLPVLQNPEINPDAFTGENMYVALKPPPPKEDDVPFVNTEITDRGFILQVAKTNGLILQMASAEIRNDREVVMAAVLNAGMTLEFASDELRNDEEFVMAAVTETGVAFKFASEELRGNRELVSKIVGSMYGLALEFASDELKADEDVCLSAVLNESSALQHCSEQIRRNHGIVLVAIMQHAWTFQYAASELSSDRDFMLAAVKRNGQMLRYAAAHLRNDREIVMESVRRYGLALGAASPKLRKDKEVVLAAVSQQGTALQYAGPELRKMRDVVLEAIMTNGASFRYAAPEFHKDAEMMATKMFSEDG